MVLSIFDKKEKVRKKLLRDRLLNKSLMQVKFSVIGHDGFILSSVLLDINKHTEKDFLLDACLREVKVIPKVGGLWRVMLVYSDKDGVHRQYYNNDEVKAILSKHRLANNL